MDGLTYTQTTSTYYIVESIMKKCRNTAAGRTRTREVPPPHGLTWEQALVLPSPCVDGGGRRGWVARDGSEHYAHDLGKGEEGGGC